MKKRKGTVIRGIPVMLIAVWVLIIALKSGAYNPYNSCGRGEYRILTEETVPFGHVFFEKQCSSSEDLTAEYFESVGIINVYTSDHAFLYAIAVYRGENGRGRLAVEGNTIYVTNRTNDLYQFRDGVCSSFVPLYQEIQIMETGETETYRKTGDLLIREDSSGESVTIATFSSSKRVAATEGLAILVVFFGAVFAVVVSILVDSGKQHRR